MVARPAPVMVAGALFRSVQQLAFCCSGQFTACLFITSECAPAVLDPACGMLLHGVMMHDYSA